VGGGGGGGKGGRCVGITLPPSCADCLEIWESQPLGTLRDYRDLYRDCFNFTSHCQPPNAVRYLPIQYARIPLQLKYCLPKFLRPKTTEVPNNFSFILTQERKISVFENGRGQLT